VTRAAGLLLEATERDVIDGENRLTEILASVLRMVPRFAARLMSEFKLPCEGPYEVNTQVHADGKFVDMEVLSLGSDGGVAGRLWAEHKIDAKFGPSQMENYLDRIQRRPGEWHLVGLVREEALNRVPGPTPPNTSYGTWQQIAGLAEHVARDLGGLRWREATRKEDGPANLMLLNELIATLERRGLAHMDPFTTSDVYALMNVTDALGRLEALWDRSQQNLLARFPPSTGEGTRAKFDRGSAYQHLETSTCWATDGYGGWGDFVCEPTDWWKPEARQMGVPCFGVGFVFDRSRAGALFSKALEEWRRDLEERGLSLADGGYVRLYGTLYLNEVVTGGLTLDDQGQFVARWVGRTLDHLIENPPPEVRGSALAPAE